MDRNIQREIAKLNYHLLHKNLRVEPIRDFGFGIFATKSILAGTMLIDNKFVIQYKRDKHSIEISGNHYYHPEAKFLNHSCDPNLFFVPRYKQFYAFTKIHTGQMLTFDYLTTEKRLAEPFHCQCGAKNCKKFIE